MNSEEKQALLTEFNNREKDRELIKQKLEKQTEALKRFVEEHNANAQLILDTYEKMRFSRLTQSSKIIIGLSDYSEEKNFFVLATLCHEIGHLLNNCDFHMYNHDRSYKLAEEVKAWKVSYQLLEQYFPEEFCANIGALLRDVQFAINTYIKTEKDWIEESDTWEQIVLGKGIRNTTQKQIKIDEESHKLECEECFIKNGNKCKSEKCFLFPEARPITESEITETEQYSKTIVSTEDKCRHILYTVLDLIDIETKSVILSKVCLSCKKEIEFTIETMEKRKANLEKQIELTEIKIGLADEQHNEELVNLCTMQIKELLRKVSRLDSVLTSGKYTE